MFIVKTFVVFPKCIKVMFGNKNMKERPFLLAMAATFSDGAFLKSVRMKKKDFSRHTEFISIFKVEIWN